MWRTFFVALIFATGALCGVTLLTFAAKDEPLFVEFNCFNDLTDGYAKINFDDIGKQVSYNPNGHWNPTGRYWQNSIVHSDQVVVWEVRRCLGTFPSDAEISFVEFIEGCEGDEKRQASEIWVFDRTDGRLSRFAMAEIGSVKMYDQYCK